MKSLFIIILSLSIVGITAITSNSTQYWAKTYGGSEGDSAYSTQQTIDGGFIVAGTTYSFGVGLSDIWMLKLDSGGNIVWQKTYGGFKGDSARSVQQTTDGGYILAGVIGYPPPPGMTPISKDETTSSCSGIWVLKLTENGNVSWQNCYGMTEGDKPTAINQTSDGGYILVGNTHYSSSTNIWVLKLDSSGDIIWQKTYVGSIIDNSTTIHQTMEGGYIIAGETLSFGDVDDCFWVLKLDKSGNVSWQKIYKVSVFGLVLSCSIQQTADGGYILAGDAGDPVVRLGIHVLKLDSNGDIVWKKTYEESDLGDLDYFSSIHQTSDGGYILAGDVKNNAGYKDSSYDFWVLKLNDNGDVMWRKVYIVSVYDSINSIQTTSDGGYIVTAETLGAGFQDILIMKLDSNGDIPFCDIVVTSNVMVSDTDINFEDRTAIVQSTFATITETNIIPQDSSAEITTICGGGFELCLLERIYGEHSEEIKLIRHFRDEVLSTTPEGQELIRLYYQWSPAIVKAIEDDEEFKKEVKETIDGIMLLIE